MWSVGPRLVGTWSVGTARLSKATDGGVGAPCAGRWGRVDAVPGGSLSCLSHGPAASWLMQALEEAPFPAVTEPWMVLLLVVLCAVCRGRERSEGTRPSRGRAGPGVAGPRGDTGTNGTEVAEQQESRPLGARGSSSAAPGRAGSPPGPGRGRWSRGFGCGSSALPPGPGRRRITASPLRRGSSGEGAGGSGSGGSGCVGASPCFGAARCIFPARSRPGRFPVRRWRVPPPAGGAVACRSAARAPSPERRVSAARPARRPGPAPVPLLFRSRFAPDPVPVPPPTRTRGRADLPAGLPAPVPLRGRAAPAKFKWLRRLSRPKVAFHSNTPNAPRAFTVRESSPTVVGKRAGFLQERQRWLLDNFNRILFVNVHGYTIFFFKM